MSGAGALAIALLTPSIVGWQAHKLLARSDSIARAAVAFSAFFILLAFWGFLSNGMLVSNIGPMGRPVWWSLMFFALHKARIASATTGAT